MQARWQSEWTSWPRPLVSVPYGVWPASSMWMWASKRPNEYGRETRKTYRLERKREIQERVWEKRKFWELEKAEGDWELPFSSYSLPLSCDGYPRMISSPPPFSFLSLSFCAFLCVSVRERDGFWVKYRLKNPSLKDRWVCSHESHFKFWTMYA